MLTAPVRIAIVGTSHVLTLFEGYQLIAGRLPARMELTFIAQGPHQVGYGVACSTGFERREPDGTLVELAARSGATHMFVSWKGSQVNIRGLLLQGPPFDVALPGEGERAFDPEVEMIPCSAVESYVHASLQADTQLAQLIEQGHERGAKIWLLGPPPALPEPAVRERLEHEPHFAGRLSEIGLTATDVRVVPSAVRVRLHALLLGVYRDFAAEHGAGFCPPPSSVADEAGLLLPDCWGKDITHGNAAYGAAYLRELVTIAVADHD
jgi:hypothetical protein